jgi:NTP pyrophosphatase (non-canonical NTP hydrolase)
VSQVEQDIKTWADSRWPTRTLASRLRKLGEEVGELAEAVCDYESVRGDGTSVTLIPFASNAAREAADCAIILSDICSMFGYSLSAVMREKFAEVQARPVAVPLDASEIRSSTADFYGRGSR